MTFLNPLFAWGLLTLPAILALYLLKRRYEVRPVPSTFLWRKASRDLSASRPFQRLRRNILLPIHLLMAAVLTLTLMRPAITGGTGGEIVMIFDLSASMQAEENGRTRLEQAVSTAENIISGLLPQDALTILTADGGTQQILSRSTDRDAAYRALHSLEPTNRDGDLSGAISLAQAMERETGALNILVFSDNYIPSGDVTAYNAGRGLDNCAIVSFTVESSVGYARIVNYGAERDVTLACYAEGSLCDARTLHIPEGETAGASFAVPDCRWAYVEIQESDAISADNRLYHVAQLQKSYTVVLSGEGSVFLERAVGLREDIRIVKVSDEERAAVAADLYIYGDSALYFSLKPEQTEISAADEVSPQGALTLAGESKLTSGLSLDSVAVRAYRPLSGGATHMQIDGRSVMASAGSTVALGFDVNDTNLPMKYDFPILVQNILRTLLPATAADIGDGICGEEIRIPLSADAQNAQIILPDGKAVAAAERFAGTAGVGLYTLRIESEEDRYFAMRMPLSESDVRSVAPSVDAEGAAASLESGLELTDAFAALFLALLLIEWGVRRRVA